MFTFRNMSVLKHPEQNYLDLVKHTLSYGKKESRRNGIVYTHIGGALRFDLSKKTMPVLTTKKIAIGSCLKELLWFISGSTNNVELKKQNVDVLLDDVDENMSNKFKKHDLIGIPYQIIVGSKTTKDKFEFKEVGKESQVLEINKIINLLKK